MTRPAAGLKTFALSASLLLVAVCLFQLSLPRIAEHFGYALSDPDRLPGWIMYQGRHYNGTGDCRTPDEVTARGFDPASPVGEVTTLWGAGHPIIATPPQDSGHSQTRTVLYVEYKADCYISYELSGGP